MDNNTILDIIAKYVKKNKNELNINDRFKEDLHLDSIDLLQIIMEVENTYNIKLKDDDLLNIITIKDAIDKANNAK